MAIIHCGIRIKKIDLTTKTADFIRRKVFDIFHNEIIAGTVVPHYEKDDCNYNFSFNINFL